MKTVEEIKFAAGSSSITIEQLSDGSMWSALGKYGLNDQGIICAEYVNGKLRFNVVKDKLGRDTVRNSSLVRDFKKFVKDKFKEISMEWHEMHNKMYGIEN